MQRKQNHTAKKRNTADGRDKRHHDLSAQEKARIAHDKHMQAKADAVRAEAQERASKIQERAERRAERIEKTVQQKSKRKFRLDVHGQPKPLMRGWIHAAATPLALASGIVLICISHGIELKLACTVFMLSSLALFGNSALYHLGNWSPQTTLLLRRLDHVNIFLLIAGTYTPISFALTGVWHRTILIGIWSTILVVMFIHLIWLSAPRWLYTSVYIIFGVAGVGFLGLFWSSPAAGPAVVYLLIAGGLCYIVGAIIYALRKPNPWPTVFGFHEIFHCATVAGYACHVVAIFLVVCKLR